MLIKERLGGDATVIVISMGQETALEALKQAIAMGADEGLRIWGPVF